MKKWILGIALIFVILVGGAFAYAQIRTPLSIVCDDNANKIWIQYGHVTEYSNAKGTVGGYVYDLRIPDGQSELYSADGIKLGVYGGLIEEGSDALTYNKFLEMKSKFPENREISCPITLSRTVGWWQ